jgi:hypothetical protein
MLLSCLSASPLQRLLFRYCSLLLEILTRLKADAKICLEGSLHEPKSDEMLLVDTRRGTILSSTWPHAAMMAMCISARFQIGQPVRIKYAGKLQRQVAEQGELCG